MTWSGFHRLSPDERLARVQAHANLSDEEQEALRGVLRMDLCDGFVENAVGSFPLPLGLAVHFVVDGEEVVVPMAIEESSVIAAASNGAKLARAGGGFATEVTEPVTIGQVELRDVPDKHAAEEAVRTHAPRWMAELDALVPSMVARGGGMRAISTRVVGDRIVAHLHVDTRDAMGANVVNTLAEAAAPWLAEATGGSIGLRILSNLSTERMATATCTIPHTAVAEDVMDAMVAANEFALADPYRAATHNKGIMNGIDPVLIATGNDWRAVEAGAHAYAARDGTYRGLTRVRKTSQGLEARLTLPMSVGTVGGVTRLHPTARACLAVLGRPDAKRLAGIVASVGLAQNLAALRALATEGIQRGHMSLHARNIAMQAGATGAEVDRVAAAMVQEGNVSVDAARRHIRTTSQP